jgi:hypothetical protein
MPPEQIAESKELNYRKLDSWLVSAFIIRITATSYKFSRHMVPKAWIALNSDSRLRKNYQEVLTLLEKTLIEDPEKRESLEQLTTQNIDFFGKELTYYKGEIKNETNILLNLEAIGFFHLLRRNFHSALSSFKKLYSLIDDKRYLFIISLCLILSGDADKGGKLLIESLQEVKQGFEYLNFWELILWIFAIRPYSSSISTVYQQIARKAETSGLPSRVWSLFLYANYIEYLMKSR